MQVDDDDDDAQSNSDNKKTGWKPGKPDYFHGDRNKFESWMNQIEIHLELEDVPNDWRKTVVAASFLRGSAQHWFQPFLTAYFSSGKRDDRSGMMEDFDIFKRELKKLFGQNNEVN